MLKVDRHQRSNTMKNVLIFLVMFFVLCPFSLFCQEAKKASVPPQKFNIGDFNYSAENRRDPFEPVYLAKVKNSKEATSLKRGYELEELKLVGILKTDKTKYAMMEDMQGKGMMFKKGDKLNNNLWVADVVDGRVILAYRLKNDIKNINIDIPKK